MAEYVSERDLRFRQHLEALGMASPAEYLAWCSDHGFRRSTDKSMKQQKDERMHHSRLAAERKVKGRIRNPRKLVEALFDGEVEEEAIRMPHLFRLHDALRHEGRLDVPRLHKPGQREAARALILHVMRAGDFTAEAESTPEGDQPYIDALIRLARRHKHWLNPPDTWRPPSHNTRRRFASLARHLLAKYDIPAFMDAAWFGREKMYRDWYEWIGGGQNLRTAPGLPIELTRREAHLALTAPDDYSIPAALRWGQVHAMGGGPRLCETLRPTRLVRSFEHEDFWQSVLRFFVGHSMLDPAHVHPIIDYIQHQKFEPEEVFIPGGDPRVEVGPPPQPGFSMHGRTPERLLAAIETWHRRLGREERVRETQWLRSGVAADWTWEELTRGGSRVWRVTELLSAKALAAQGRAHTNCVASYAQSCSRGACSIWTLTSDSPTGHTNHLTIEVRHRAVVQARGPRNSLPSPREMQVLSRWAGPHGVGVSTYL